LNLEPVEIKFSSEKSEFEGVEKESLKTMNKALIAKLGLDSYYWEVYDPTIGSDKEPTQGWLVDDFADMYADLKNELHKIEHVRTDEAIEDALWQLKFGFTHHWGIHCVCAMRALHFLWYPGKEAM
jgi:hypothetical protein